MDYALPDVAGLTPAGPPVTGYAFETPASLACLYGLVTTVAGCNPNTFKTNPTGGTKAIGIVDAFDYPTAMADLNDFSTQFGLPKVTAPTFKVIFAGGTGGCAGSDPGNDPGWEGEQALDIDMAHAMSPNAKIFLVEAASSLRLPIFWSLRTAPPSRWRRPVAARSPIAGVGLSSQPRPRMDSHFVHAGIVYLASSGDSAGTSWPNTSRNVVSVGGTTTRRVSSGATFGNFIAEAAWEDGGGGLSLYEPRPSYQSVLPAASHRLVPDVSSDANPNTGVWVYDSNATFGIGLVCIRRHQCLLANLGRHCE